MRAVYIIIGVIIVGVLVWGFATNWGRGGKSIYSTPSPTPTSSESATPMSGQVSVSINNFAFDPASIMVTKGTTVTWTNMQNVEHTITSDKGVFSSNPLPTGSTFSYTFNDTGSFPYHCSIHTTMHGTVTVQ